MKILFLQKRPLFPPDTGGKIRTLNVLRHLAQWHEITYLCNVQPGEQAYLDQMRGLGVELETVAWREAPRRSLRFYAGLAGNLLSRYPFNVNKDYDARLRKRARELLNQHRFDLLVCDFVQMARNVIGLNAPASLLFQHNVEAEIFKRHAQHGSRLRRWYMQEQWRKMRHFEGAAGTTFDRVVAVSGRDREIFRQEYRWRQVDVIDTAVDLDFFQPDNDAEVTDRVVFVGSLDWLPNEDGVEWFVRDVWPRVKARRPAATFHVVGRNPSAHLQRLARYGGVKVLGSVPDVRPHLSNAAVVVVPLLVGGGTRLKIFEAMAMQRAIVSTTLGAEGLDVTPGEHLLLGDRPWDMAENIVQLLQDDQRRRQLAASGRRLVEARYCSETVARQFEDVCQKTIETASGGRTTPSRASSAGALEPSSSMPC